MTPRRNVPIPDAAVATLAPRAGFPAAVRPTAAALLSTIAALMLVVLVLLLGGVFAPAPAAASAASAKSIKPKIVKKYVRYDSTRRAQMARYSKRHYHQNTYKLTNPKAVVLHHTAGADWQSAWYTFNGNSAYNHEKPGVSAHFIIHKDGTIYQCVPLWIRARHCLGMNWKSIGIEFVQEMRSGKDGHWMDRQILNRDKQIRSGLRLVRYLKKRFGIRSSDIVGHATANGSRFFKDYTGVKNAAGDWYSAEVKKFRARL